MLTLAVLFVYFTDIYLNYRMVLYILFGIATLFICINLGSWGYHHLIWDEDKAKQNKDNSLKLMFNKFYIILSVLMIISPSVKTIYISSGLLIGQQAVNKAENSELLNKAYKVLELQMDIYLDEIINPVKLEESKSK